MDLPAIFKSSSSEFWLEEFSGIGEFSGVLRIVVGELRCGKLCTPEGLILVVNQRDKDKNRQIIEKHYYGIPISAIETYISICEECLGCKKKVTKKNQNPLKMILMSHIGQRCQVDLVDMTSQEDPITGNKWILRYVDHLSGYGYVRCLPSKESKYTAQALVEIISESIEPIILQSDNGSEFLGE